MCQGEGIEASTYRQAVSPDKCDISIGSRS